jgi:hypothetical protein
MTESRTLLRHAAAALSGLVAVLYALTGMGWVAVTEGQAPGVIPPLLVGAAVFAGLAVLALFRTGRAFFVAGAVVQVPAILMYLAVAAERVPAFEVWGITIKLLQVLLLGAFAWLALQRPTPAPPRERVRAA